MNKVLKVLLGVVAVILALKFLTSGFFIWMVIAAALPQVLKYICKNCGVVNGWVRRIYANRYTYTLIFMVALPLILGVKIGLMIAAAVGVGLSYLMFEDIK